MKSIFLLSVCVASLSVNFARQPLSQRDQDVIKNVAAIKKAIHEIENCLSMQAQAGDVSDIDLPTDADASETDTDGRSTINRSVVPGRLRAKPKSSPISVEPFAPVVIKREPHITSHPKSEIQQSELESQLNSTAVNKLVTSLYSKAIAEISASNSVELGADEESFPEIAKLSLRIQIIMDPQQLIYDELAKRSLQVGLSASLRTLIAAAEEDNKELINQYSEAVKTPKGKKYIKHLKNTMAALKVKANAQIAELLYGEKTEGGYKLTLLGTTLINSLSAQLAKNGIFRQHLVNNDGKPTLLDTATVIESDSSQDNVYSYG